MLNIEKDLLIKYPKLNPYNKPQLEKIILDITISSKTNDNSNILPIIYTSTYLTGQFPTIKKATQSVASFKLRKGSDIGVKTTLRNFKMFNFLKLLSLISLPHLAATNPGFEYIKNSKKSNYGLRPSGLSTSALHSLNLLNNNNLALGIHHLSSLNIWQQSLLYQLPFKLYSGGANLQFIFNLNHNFKQNFTFHSNLFILSSLLFPIAH